MLTLCDEDSSHTWLIVMDVVVGCEMRWLGRKAVRNRSMGKRKVVNIVEDNVIAHGEREYEPKVQDCSPVEEEAPLLLLCNDEDMRNTSLGKESTHERVELL